MTGTIKLVEDKLASVLAKTLNRSDVRFFTFHEIVANGLRRRQDTAGFPAIDVSIDGVSASEIRGRDIRFQCTAALSVPCSYNPDGASVDALRSPLDELFISLNRDVDAFCEAITVPDVFLAAGLTDITIANQFNGDRDAPFWGVTWSFTIHGLWRPPKPENEPNDQEIEQ